MEQEKLDKIAKLLETVDKETAVKILHTLPKENSELTEDFKGYLKYVVGGTFAGGTIGAGAGFAGGALAGGFLAPIGGAAGGVLGSAVGFKAGKRLYYKKEVEKMSVTSEAITLLKSDKFEHREFIKTLKNNSHPSFILYSDIGTGSSSDPVDNIAVMMYFYKLGKLDNSDMQKGKFGRQQKKDDIIKKEFFEKFISYVIDNMKL